MICPASPRITTASIASGPAAARSAGGRSPPPGRRPGTLRRRSAGGAGLLEEAQGVAARRLVAGAGAEHAAELLHALVAVDPADDRLRDARARVALLGDRELPVGEGGDLRQMRDAEHLAALGQAAEPHAQRRRRHAADARVDLVEDERLDVVAEGHEPADGEHRP